MITESAIRADLLHGDEDANAVPFIEALQPRTHQGASGVAG